MDMEAVACPICFDTIFPCEEIAETNCASNQHVMHLSCMNKYLATQPANQPLRCPVCRQFTLTLSEWVDLAIIFGFDPDDYEWVEELSPEAQEYARRYQRGELMQEQLREEAKKLYIERVVEQTLWCVLLPPC